jgi:hypothetical protein
MKRLLCVIIAALLLLGLVSCGSGGGTPGNGNESQSNSASPPSSAEQNTVTPPEQQTPPEQPPQPEPEPEPEPQTPPADPISEKMAQMAGNYELDNYTNYSQSQYFSYDILRNYCIRSGAEPGTMTLGEDGKGRLSYIGNELSFEWTEEAFIIDGKEYPVHFSYPELSIDLSENESLSYRLVSHLKAFDLTADWYDSRKAVDASAYELGAPEVVHFNESSRKYVFVRVPVENKSDGQLVLDQLYFTALGPDGRELGFYALPASCTKVLLPGEKGDFVYNFLLPDEYLYFPGQAAADAFPEGVVIKVDEVDAYIWTGEYKRYDAEITEMLVSVNSQTGAGMLHRPNGFVALPEGANLDEIEFYVYCYDKEGKLVGFGSQFAVQSSINPVLFLEEIPGENRAKFQTNMIGPFEDMSFPQDSIDRYEIVAFSPRYYY